MPSKKLKVFYVISFGILALGFIFLEVRDNIISHRKPLLSDEVAPGTYTYRVIHTERVLIPLQGSYHQEIKVFILEDHDNKSYRRVAKIPEGHESWKLAEILMPGDVVEFGPSDAYLSTDTDKRDHPSAWKLEPANPKKAPST